MAEADPPKHPAAHVPVDKRHQLLISERNLLVTARAERQNELVKTITQLSSGAILLIPTVLLTKDVSVPRFGDAKAFYVGLALLAGSLVLSVLEQHLSAWAYSEQEKVVIDYYLLKSERDHAVEAAAWVRWSRTGAFIAFVAGLCLAGAGLATQV